MKKHYTVDLKEGEDIIDFYLVRSSSIKMGSNRKPYLDIMLGDATGDVTAKKWDVNENNEAFLASIKAGDIVKVQAQVTDWKGQRQLRIGKIRFARKEDGLVKSDFFKAAPEEPQEMYDYIMSRIDAFEDEELKAVCKKLYEDNHDRIMYWPAAMSNHHAEYAGLLYHVKRMMMMGERACEVYTNLSKDLLLAGVAIHDIEKLNEIMSDQNGVSPGYSFKGQLLGHIVQGVTVVDEVCRELGVSEEKAVMLEHMILSHHYEPEFGSPKKPLFPEAEMLHYLDIVDAKMFDMQEALEGVEPGEFGDRIWTLDNRRPYKRTF
jgi:3'-5' exoribonuclease